MRNILFVAYGAGHVRTVLPIIQDIKSDPKLASEMNPILLALTTARHDAERVGVPFIGFANLVKPDLDAQALRIGRKLVGAPAPDAILPDEESVAYMGLSYFDLVQEHGEEEAKALYAEKGRAAFLPVQTAMRTLDDLDIDCVVSTNAPRAERAFLMAAEKTDRPSLTIWSSLATHEIAWVGQPGFSTYVCVDGPYAATQLQKAGRPEHEIRVTGNPQYDQLLWKTDAQDTQSFRDARGWADTDKVLLFAQQNEPKYHAFLDRTGDPQLPQKLNDALISSLGSVADNLKLCIRYHPNQPPLAVPDERAIYISDQSDDLAVLLHAVDAVFTCSSTVAYQAALIGKPVVQGMFSMYSEDVAFDAMLGARRVGDWDGFGAVWQDLSDDALPQPTLSSSLQQPAATNIINILKELPRYDPSS